MTFLYVNLKKKKHTSHVCLMFHLNILYPSPFFIFLATLHGMWDPSSLTRDQTHIPGIGSTDFFFFRLLRQLTLNWPTREVPGWVLKSIFEKLVQKHL